MKRLIFYIVVIVVLSINMTVSAVTLNYGSIGPDVRSLQLRLIELEYYTAEVSGEFDMNTQAALDSFRRQTGINISDGLDDFTWDKLCSIDAPIKKNSESIKNLVPGSKGEQVTALQSRLLELGYFKNKFTAGDYDPETQFAQDRFCIANGINTQSGADESLQTLVFSSGVKAYEEAQTISIGEETSKIKSFFLKPIKIKDKLELPSYIFYILGVILLAIIILLIIKIISGHKVSDLKIKAKSEKNPLSFNNKELSLTVNFDDKQQKQSYSLNGIFSIGRSGDGLKLDPKDVGASRKHCDMYYQGDVLIIRDHSQSGTYINGTRLNNSEAPIKAGDVIQISRHSIIIE